MPAFPEKSLGGAPGGQFRKEVRFPAAEGDVTSARFSECRVVCALGVPVLTGLAPEGGTVVQRCGAAWERPQARGSSTNMGQLGWGASKTSCIYNNGTDFRTFTAVTPAWSQDENVLRKGSQNKKLFVPRGAKGGPSGSGPFLWPPEPQESHRTCGPWWRARDRAPCAGAPGAGPSRAPRGLVSVEPGSVLGCHSLAEGPWVPVSCGTVT